MRRKRERRNQSNVSLNTHACVKANISELIKIVILKIVTYVYEQFYLP